MDRIRLGEFAKWTGEERETMRGSMHRGDAPIKKTRGDEKQRTYDGADLLAWCLFTMLRRSGVTPSLAGEAILQTNVVENFFQSMERGDDVSDWHVIFCATRRDRGAKGKIEIVSHTYGSPDDVADILCQEAQGYGQPNPSGYIRLGVISMNTVPVWPCYQRCVDTAKAHGLEMRGPHLSEL